MSTDKPKPCPFCGNTKDFISCSLKVFEPNRYFIHCPVCKTAGPMGRAFEDEAAGVLDAIKQWNKRA